MRGAENQCGFKWEYFRLEHDLIYSLILWGGKVEECGDVGRLGKG